jgi:copper chaperone CopZ
LVVFFIGCEKQEDEQKVLTENPDNISIPQNSEIKTAPEENIEIRIPTARCKTCEKTLNSALSKVEGIITADVDVHDKIVNIKYLSSVTSPGKIREAISKAGYDADEIKRNEQAYQNLPECCRDGE